MKYAHLCVRSSSQPLEPRNGWLDAHGTRCGSIQLTRMSPGAAVTRFVGEKSADFVALGSHGQGRVLHKSLASYLMQRPLDIRGGRCRLDD